MYSYITIVYQIEHSKFRVINISYENSVFNFRLQNEFEVWIFSIFTGFMEISKNITQCSFNNF